MTSLLVPVSRSSAATWLTDAAVVRAQAVAGLVVAPALIPQASSSSIPAGVAVSVGLLASFTTAVTIAFTGGTPGLSATMHGRLAGRLGGHA